MRLQWNLMIYTYFPYTLTNWTHKETTEQTKDPIVKHMRLKNIKKNPIHYHKIAQYGVTTALHQKE